MLEAYLKEAETAQRDAVGAADARSAEIERLMGKVDKLFKEIEGSYDIKTNMTSAPGNEVEEVMQQAQDYAKYADAPKTSYLDPEPGSDTTDDDISLTGSDSDYSDSSDDSEERRRKRRKAKKKKKYR